MGDSEHISIGSIDTRDGFAATLTLEGEDGLGFVLTPAFYDDGLPKFPLWVDLASRTRETTYTVMEAIIVHYSDLAYEPHVVQQTGQMVFAMMGKMLKYVTKDKMTYKNQLLISGMVNLEMAEAMDIFEDAMNAARGD